MNELILIIVLIIVYSSVILFNHFFGRNGLYGLTVFVLILANIEVNVIVNAFGMQQTLGNILFAASFVITDIASELYGKKESNKIVNVGIFASLLYVFISQTWKFYIPSDNFIFFEQLNSVFANTARLIFASMITNAIVQKLDVWGYHKIWGVTEKIFHSREKFLWVRNNLSTLVSQLFNSLLFTFIAFFGVFDIQTLISITFSTYIIYIFTSLLDTPVVYISRYLYERKEKKNECSR